MDSDPEPRTESRTPSTKAAPLPVLSSSQTEEPPEEPPSPSGSAAIVLGPLIALLTLAVPCLSVLTDRLGAGAQAPQPARTQLIGGWPPPPGHRAPLP